MMFHQAAMHLHGSAIDIVHGNIKPENVLIFKYRDVLTAEMTGVGFSCFGTETMTLFVFHIHCPGLLQNTTQGALRFGMQSKWMFTPLGCFACAFCFRKV